jgi:hypothetical protein
MSTQGQRQPARAAYFHNSLFGYHAAKLGRYNELMEFHIYNNNMNVLNMLNTKYIIAEEQGQIFPYDNPDANGNAWFVRELEELPSANEEIKALDSLNTKQKAVTSMSEYSSNPETLKFKLDSTASIELKEFKPNYLKYESNNTNDGFAVFSEIYYKDGWNAYIDGELKPHIRVNYVLRGMEVPAGKYTIEFKFEPKVIETGSEIALASSAVFGVLLFLGVFYGFKAKEKE